MVITGGFRTSALARGERTNAERAEYLDLFVVVIAREQTRRDWMVSPHNQLPYRE